MSQEPSYSGRQERLRILYGLGDNVDNNLFALTIRAENVSSKDGDRNLTLIGQFYRAGMDTAAIEKAGLTSLKNDLAIIDAIGSR